MGRMFGGQIRTVCSVDLRYGEQVYEISVPLDGLDVSAPGLMNALVSRFHRLHNELYTYSRPAQDVVMINARIAIIGDLPAPPAEPESLHSRPAAPRTHRQIYLDGDRRVPVYDMEALARDQVVPGPALVEAATTTVLLRSDDQATVTRHGWLDIDVGNSAERR
jgi:N-methylhydantoinase A